MNTPVVTNEQTYAGTRTPLHPVRFYRLAFGLTRGQLAEAAGVHPNTITNVERRRHLPTLSTARKISDALRLPVAEVFPEFEGWEK